MGLPKLSTITPSFRQARFLEQTITSVLSQGYDNLEYIIIDGGSKDESINIIKKHEKQIAYWISEPDYGQSHAINKGLSYATGEILAWINSDDYYHPGIFDAVVQKYLADNEKNTFWVVFAIEHLDQDTGQKWVTPQQEANSLDDWLVHNVQVNQQGAFWSRQITERIGMLDEELHLGMDTEYFMRMMVHGYTMERVNDVVAGTFRMHGASKTGNFHGEIVDRDKSFAYEWTLSRLRYLPKDHAKYEELRTKYRSFLAQCELRFSQNSRNPRSLRLRYLLKALRTYPKSIYGRACWSSVRRLLAT